VINKQKKQQPTNATISAPAKDIARTSTIYFLLMLFTTPQFYGKLSGVRPSVGLSIRWWCTLVIYIFDFFLKIIKSTEKLGEILRYRVANIHRSALSRGSCQNLMWVWVGQI